MVGTAGGRGTQREPGVWAQGRAPTTVGILLLISLTAFESMGVGTAMPAVVADLGGVALYAWPFVLFLAAAVFGGRWCDARGPRPALVVAPAVHALGPPAGPQAGRGGSAPVLAALAAAVGVAGLSWAFENVDARGAAVGAVALVLLVPALRRLLPGGVLAARPGIASVVAARGLVAGAFFTVGAFLPLVLTSTHGWSLAAAGLPLVVASLGWSGAAAWQGRRPELDRPAMLRTGFATIAAGQLGLLPVAAGALPGWLAVGLWGLSGVGMGLAFSALAYLTLAHSGAADVGSHSSSAQLLDQLATAAFIGLGGAMLVLLVSPAVAMPVLLAVVAALALTGAAIAGRSRVPA